MKVFGVGESQKNEILKIFKSADYSKDSVLERMDFYSDLSWALNDVTRGLANLFPHKRSVAKLGALPEPFESIIKSFSKEGILVQELPVSFKNPDLKALDEAFDALKKDTLFVAASREFPVARLDYPVAWLQKKCFEKNMFCILHESLEAFSEDPILPKHPFECTVFDFWREESPFALAVGGERYRHESLLWGESVFSNQQMENLKATLKNGLKPHHKKCDWSAINKKLGSISGIEIFDSAGARSKKLIFVKGADGSAIHELMAAKSFAIDTLSAFRWNKPWVDERLHKLGFNHEEIQTSVVLDYDECQKTKFLDVLKESIAYCQKHSGFSP